MSGITPHTQLAQAFKTRIKASLNYGSTHGLLDHQEVEEESEGLLLFGFRIGDRLM